MNGAWMSGIADTMRHRVMVALGSAIQSVSFGAAFVAEHGIWVLSAVDQHTEAMNGKS